MIIWFQLNTTRKHYYNYSIKIVNLPFGSDVVGNDVVEVTLYESKELVAVPDMFSVNEVVLFWARITGIELIIVKTNSFLAVEMAVARAVVV